MSAPSPQEAECLSCGGTGGVAREVTIPMPEEQATIRLCVACRARLAAGEFYKLGS